MFIIRCNICGNKFITKKDYNLHIKNNIICYNYSKYYSIIKSNYIV